MPSVVLFGHTFVLLSHCISQGLWPELLAHPPADRGRNQKRACAFTLFSCAQFTWPASLTSCCRQAPTAMTIHSGGYVVDVDSVDEDDADDCWRWLC